MKRILSGIVAIALAAPLAVSSANAAYEEAWKPMTSWFHVTHPVEASTYQYGSTGSVDPRTGYREYRGLWVPESAADTMTTGRMSAAHVSWCREHYVSYRASDNTYEPGRGARKACVTPM